MTILLGVREVLRDPHPFERGFRLVVAGRLEIDGSGSLRLHDTVDHASSLEIDDEDAKRAVLAQASGAAELGLANVEAWTRCETGKPPVLRDVVSIALDETKQLIRVRPHAWGEPWAR